MRLRIQPLIASALVALVACSSSNATHTDAGADVWTYQTPPVPAGAYLYETNTFDVSPTTDTLMCTYMPTLLDHDVISRELHSYQAPGGHHAVLFYQPMPYTGSDLGVTRPCTEQDMVDSRLVGGGDESHEEALTLPEGLGVKILAGSQLMIQSHYIPTVGGPTRVRDAMVLVPAAPGQVTTLADALAISDGDMRIPAHSAYGQTIEYVVDVDTNVAMLLGHMHQWGTSFRVDLLHPDGSPTETLYAPHPGTQLMSNPPTTYYTTAMPLLLHAGDHVRVYCDWNNTTDHEMEFPEEMCVALMYYFPARGFLSGGNVIETHGGSDGGVTTTGGNTGCIGEPGPMDDCVRPCNRGNEEGVGKYCTAGGNQCAGNHGAILCTVDLSPGATPFCTKPCSSDAICGSGAVCLVTSGGGGCEPVECTDGWGRDAGVDAGVDASAGDDAMTSHD